MLSFELSVLQCLWPCALLQHTRTNSTCAFPGQGQLLRSSITLEMCPCRPPRALRKRPIITAHQAAGTAFLSPKSSENKRNDRFFHAPLDCTAAIKKMDKGSNFVSWIPSTKEAIDVEIFTLFENEIIKLCKEKPVYH